MSFQPEIEITITGCGALPPRPPPIMVIDPIRIERIDQHFLTEAFADYRLPRGVDIIEVISGRIILVESYRHWREICQWHNTTAEIHELLEAHR